MIMIFFQIFWLLLPAGFANMAPVLFKKFFFFDYPIDLNKKFRGNPLFGKNKTYNGFLFGILTSIFIVFIQQLVYPYTQGISLIDYSKINIYFLGFLLGFGALFGDLTESFFKRRLNIAPGKTWFPFDQIDWVIGALVFVSFYIVIYMEHILVSLFSFGLLHCFINLMGYYLGFKKNKF